MTCGDGVACNGAEACDPGTGLCAAAASTCLEGEACDPALDTCNAGCGGGCAFDATCYPSGASHPDSACVLCVGSAWSNADGLACDDGMACTTADVCSAGVCAGAALVCNDGVACNGVEFCDAGTGACVLGASLCAAGEYCDLDAGVCTAEPCAGCEIAGICYPNDTPNPANACAVCHVGTSRETWTDVSGVACDDGSSCTTGDTCWFGSCEGMPVVCDDAVACNGVETCSEVTGLCVDGTTTCTGELMCDVATDACVPAPCAGCEIGGICYLDGAQDPTNPCAICEVSSSRTDWSAGSGLACDDGDPCTSSDVCAAGSCIGAPVVCDDGVACNGTETCAPETGLCVDGATTCASDLVCDEIVDECVCTGCLIDGTCYADGAVGHSDACQVCDVATSTTAWSVAPGCP